MNGAAITGLSATLGLPFAMCRIASMIPPMVGLIDQFYEELVESGDRLVALHTGDLESSLEQFQALCRGTGRSVYHWSDHHGLRSLKAADINVPGTRGLTDALRYVVQSMHYGVYVFTGFERQIQLAGSQNLLQRIHGLEDGYDRKVLLVAENIQLPRHISRLIKHVFLEKPSQLNPRLRDGRWVV